MSARPSDLLRSGVASLAGQHWGPTTRGARDTPAQPCAPGSPPGWSSLPPVAAHPNVRLSGRTAAGTAQHGRNRAGKSLRPPSAELAGAVLPREADSAGNGPGLPLTGRGLHSPFPWNRHTPRTDTHRGRERGPTPGARIPALPWRPAGGFGGAWGTKDSQSPRMPPLLSGGGGAVLVLDCSVWRGDGPRTQREGYSAFLSIATQHPEKP